MITSLWKNFTSLAIYFQGDLLGYSIRRWTGEQIHSTLDSQHLPAENKFEQAVRYLPAVGGSCDSAAGTTVSAVSFTVTDTYWRSTGTTPREEDLFAAGFVSVDCFVLKLDSSI